jgi:hypothetical protein
MAAEVQDGQVQQLFLNEVEDVEHAAGAAVAVGERVDGFELVVAHGHADQRVQLGLVVQKALPVGQHVAQAGFAFGRGVDHLAGAVVGELGARGAADVHVHALEGAADVHGGGGAQRPGLERLKALVQRGAVAQASLVAGSALSWPCAYWNSWSVVVTMFSISELSLASSSGMVLISIAWLGMSSAACLSSASAARASMQALSTARVSSSCAGAARRAGCGAAQGARQRRRRS